MSEIIDTLFIKRFCLPSNVDLASFEFGNAKVSDCLCGNYNHAACILQRQEPSYEKG